RRPQQLPRFAELGAQGAPTTRPPPVLAESGAAWLLGHGRLDHLRVRHLLRRRLRVPQPAPARAVRDDDRGGLRGSQVFGSRHMVHTGGPAGTGRTSRCTSNPWCRYQATFPSVDVSRYAGTPVVSRRPSTASSSFPPSPSPGRAGSTPITARRGVEKVQEHGVVVEGAGEDGG